MADALMNGTSVMSSFKEMFKNIVKELISQAIKLAVIQPYIEQHTFTIWIREHTNWWCI